MVKSKLNVGLGLRRELIDSLQTHPIQTNAGHNRRVDFLELAPENWMGIGGKLKKDFQVLKEIYPMVCHGLSLSLGGPSPLNFKFLKQIKKFLDENKIEFYSEHLSYTTDHGQLYDLLPIPFTEEAVKYVSKRIRKTQEILERRISIENVSYYLMPPISEMSELDFVCAVLEEADCKLLLDVNNIYVNSVNQKYDAHEFLEKIPRERIAYIHIAGHYRKSKNLLIDTHGTDVDRLVWDLLDHAYATFGVFPTLLERDFNLPPLEDLLKELDQILEIQKRHREVPHARSA